MAVYSTQLCIIEYKICGNRERLRDRHVHHAGTELNPKVTRIRCGYWGKRVSARAIVLFDVPWA